MSKMFIPPSGAMQFEFDPGFEERGRQWVWVEPASPCPDGNPGYLILEWDDTLLCTCHGRIIE